MKKPEKWAALRNRGLGAKTQSSFDGIFWDPQTIYSGQAIELNVSEVQKILAKIRAKKEIHLASASGAHQRDISIQGSHQGGEIAANKVTSQKRKAQNPTLSGGFDTETTYTLQLDFKGHAEAVENVANPELLPDEFFSRINEDFIEGVRLVIFYNYLQTVTESENSTDWDKGLGVETTSEIAVFLMFCASFPIVMLSLIGSQDVSKSLQISFLLATAYSYVIRQIFVLFSIFAYSVQKEVPSQDKNFISRYGEYVVEKALKGNLLPLLILDQRTAELWHFPLIMSFIHKPKYFRRATKNTEN